MVAICSLFPDLHIRHNNIALANDGGNVFACLFLCVCSSCSVVVLLCLLRFQILNAGVVKTGEKRRVKCVVFFSALYNSKHVFNKLNFVVHSSRFDAKG